MGVSFRSLTITHDDPAHAAEPHGFGADTALADPRRVWRLDLTGSAGRGLGSRATARPDVESAERAAGESFSTPCTAGLDP